MTVREQVLHQVELLGEADLRQLARYLGLLRSQPRKRVGSFDPEQVAALYAECAEEDRLLAEQGMADYADQLASEDTR